jgi:hypothetical protein
VAGRNDDRFVAEVGVVACLVLLLRVRMGMLWL